MSLPEKAAAVQHLFKDLDESISQFQSKSTLHCNFGCGKCCFKPDIEATILEFIPLAMRLHQEGIAEKWYEELKNAGTAICKVLNPTQSGAGLCSIYNERGLICRLFGYSARTNKYGEKELVTCRIIKTEQAEAFERTAKEIASGMHVPVMTDYYHRLQSIDPDLTHGFFPINQAIRKALEVVLQYFAYRADPRSL